MKNEVSVENLLQPLMDRLAIIGNKHMDVTFDQEPISIYLEPYLPALDVTRLQRILTDLIKLIERLHECNDYGEVPTILPPKLAELMNASVHLELREYHQTLTEYLKTIEMDYLRDKRTGDSKRQKKLRKVDLEVDEAAFLLVLLRDCELTPYTQAQALDSVGRDLFDVAEDGIRKSISRFGNRKLDHSVTKTIVISHLERMLDRAHTYFEKG